MGIIDIAIITLTCETCGIEETHKCLDKGSMWSGSSWGEMPEFEHFDVESRGGGYQEPEIISATCKRCGSKAKENRKYRV